MYKLKSLVLAVIGLLCSLSVSAYDFEVDGIYYSITSESDKTVEVTYQDYYYNGYSGAVTIPETVTDPYYVETYSVTSIGMHAFKECSDLTSVAIPNSVTSIGGSAFYGCSGLTSVAIPNSVTSIGSYAFYNCSGLTSVAIPNSVTSIGDYTFYDCNSLTSVVIPNSVTSIGDYAFYDCNSLTSVVIPNSVTSIGSYAFYNCSGLTSVEIGNSVTSIGYGAFYGCYSLDIILNRSNFTFTKGMSYDGYIAYYAKRVVNKYDGRLGDFIFAKDHDTYFLQAYVGSETELVLPANYKGSNYAIGGSAFSGCYNLTSVEIPNSVTSIGDYAFYDCNSLTSVVIPNSVTSIGDYAFYDCCSLTSVVIPNSVTNIGANAFSECDYLTTVSIEDVAAWCNIDFGNSSANPLSNMVILYLNGERVTDLVIPNSVTSIGDYAFYNCYGLTSVDIPNSVTSIGAGTFYGCSNLTSVDIPNSVTSIGDYAFYNCSDLTSVEIPNSVTSIGDYAFYNCSGLTSIPNSVTSIGDYAFYSCSGLTSIPNSVTSIGDYAFNYCKGLTSVDIPNSVTSIGAGTFYGCSNLTSVDIPNSVTDIGYCAFSNCKGLTSVDIPNSVTSIGGYAFYGCLDLTSVEIGSGVTSIGGYAFSNCSSLTSVTSSIPANKLFPIDSYTFYRVDTDQCTLYVPKGAKETYATMEGWWYVFKNIVEIHPGYELTVTDAGYSTLYLDFTAEIPEGVEVYTAKEVDGVLLQMEQVEELLPANTGVLVKAPAGTYKFAYSNTTAPSIENNLFKGSETDKYINVPSSSSAFVLSKVDGEVGMYLAKLTDGSFLNNANKAYLLIDNNKLGLSDDELDTSVDGAQLSLRFNFGGATDIDKVNTESYNTPVIYDMYGRKVQQIMRPGLYIINGKKVMMK